MSPALQHVESLVAGLSKSEKAHLVQFVIGELGNSFPGIESRPGVCGGEACVVRTRIPVWVLEQARRLGSSEADLLANYPTLRAADLVQAWAYAHANQDEIEAAIRKNDNA